ncbi:MAG TPA: DNA adenine methylase [Polyangiaceae bacterium]|jgi:DNA adenine methylase
MTREPEPRPVLKWAGGKRRLAPRIAACLPERIRTYYEPFVGGGAVFFALAAERRFERAVISDRNRDLVEVYRALQSNVDSLIDELTRYTERHSETEYYRVRELRPRSRVARAARVIYLNKTGYNGLYRVNRDGRFNVPMGRYANPTICDEARLRAAARALSGVEILTEDFENVCRKAAAGDAVYFDPPYLPVSRTSSFAAYDAYPFDLDEHRRLARVFSELARRGVRAVLSNSFTPDTETLYAHFSPEVIGVPRPINSVASRRGSVAELLVVNRRRARDKAAKRVATGR